MTHSYYLDTLGEFRSVERMMFDLVLFTLMLVFLFAGLTNLREKGYIENYHEPWTIDENGTWIP